ncbi:leucine-rich repeat-containing protein 74A [Arapaima gigas]
MSAEDGGGEATSGLSMDSLSLEDRTPLPFPQQLTAQDGWDTDLEADEVSCPTFSQAERYLQACHAAAVVPVSYYLRNLGARTLNLNHHGLGPLGAKALAKALETDVHITELELEDNFLLAEGTQYMVKMLKGNLNIQHVNLSNNHLQTAGAESIIKMLADNISLTSIRLSGNGFIDKDAKYFADAFSSNNRVKELDLSHNRFCGHGGEYLSQMLANNESLESLDLSWNHLRMKGAVALSAGLKVNMILKRLNLSWNGFGNEGALALGEALKYNNTLVYLDLSHNRVTNEGACTLCRGLEINSTLRVLQLAYNSLTVEGALVLLSTVKNSSRCALEQINISNVLVNENFLQLLEVTCHEHPALEVHYGGVGGFISKKPPKRPDPMKIIQDYLDERKLRLWDFFRNIDKDGTMCVPVSDFRKAVQQSSIPLNRYQLEELIQKLDKEGTGTVDYRGLADRRKKMMRDHRRQLRKVESRQKKEKQKSERILKTFQSAVEAVTPHSSMVMSPGGIKENSGGPQHFSATPLSSWHYAVISNNSRYSITEMSSEGVRLPSIGGIACSPPASSPAVSSYSKRSLLDDTLRSGFAKAVSARGVDTLSSPDVVHSTMSPMSSHLTRSRPALTMDQCGPRVKAIKARKKKGRR